MDTIDMENRDMENIDVIRRFNRACDAHDVEAVCALLADDVVFESTSPAPDGEQIIGKATVRALIGPIVSDPASRFEIEETIAFDGRIAQRSTYRWADGHVRALDLLRVRDGLIVEVLSYVKG